MNIDAGWKTSYLNLLRTNMQIFAYVWYICAYMLGGECRSVCKHASTSMLSNQFVEEDDEQIHNIVKYFCSFDLHV